HFPSFFFSSRRRHTRFSRDWSSDVCSSDLSPHPGPDAVRVANSRAFSLALEREWAGESAEPAGGADPRSLPEYGTLVDTLDGLEIGRASWRERVWRWGGSRSLIRKEVLNAV